KGTNRVIAGHGRLLAMKQLAWETCDVVELDVSNLDATALGIALNRTAELASWDEQVLARLLNELKEEGSLDGVGCSDAEVDELLEVLDEESAAGDLEDPGVDDPPEEPVSRRGDLWLLGDHRLLCGDSTSREDFAKLMAG